MYDAVSVHTVSADENAASNGLISNGVATVLYLHKAVLTGDGSNAVLADVYDDINVSNSATIKVSMNTSEVSDAGQYERMITLDFNPPIAFNKGVSSNLTGNTATLRLYYTRS